MVKLELYSKKKRIKFISKKLGRNRWGRRILRRSETRGSFCMEDFENATRTSRVHGDFSQTLETCFCFDFAVEKAAKTTKENLVIETGMAK